MQAATTSAPAHEHATDLPSPLTTTASAAAWCLGSAVVLYLCLVTLGVDRTVTRVDGRTVEVGLAQVVVSVLFACAAGGLVLSTLGVRRRSWWRATGIAGAVLAVASLAAPLTSQASAGTLLLLVGMHLACGLAWCGAVLHPLRAARH